MRKKDYRKKKQMPKKHMFRQKENMPMLRKLMTNLFRSWMKPINISGSYPTAGKKLLRLMSWSENTAVMKSAMKTGEVCYPLIMRCFRL